MTNNFDLRILTGSALPLLGWASSTPLNPDHVTRVDPYACRPGKPSGGLWTSPLINSSDRPPATAWTRWCRSELPHRRPTTLTVLRALADARVLVIDHHDDMTVVDRIYGRGSCAVPQMPTELAAVLGDEASWQELATQRWIDWEAIAGDVEGVQVTETGLCAGGGTIPRLRWDVPTVWFTRPTFDIVEELPLPDARR